ncbi:hypothetical protein F4813DRAFT_32075 [Daldinia decipiens]|uniref:uncharacterized protein n=1 Tax=Daldinia decipiens TaxID=326647 RepID=UPI0020C4DA83|nr:uncharacterized protein F4813DRAFT_32075 [Daldinia decipiens]KAI1658871.1 hypothetical protein F4813DRAFT_32075 [Daldinia decipiens]
MFNFLGELFTVDGLRLIRGPQISNSSAYNVIAIHGIGDIEAQGLSWTCERDKDQASWLTSFLPDHIHCYSVMAFNYHCERFDEGISIADLRKLANMLLDQLLSLLPKENAGPIVFIAQDIGGLIVKEVLSIAMRCSKYHLVAGNTSLLVFFNTPHRVSNSRSWESIANWLLIISGRDRSYNTSWIIKTSDTLKRINEAFDTYKYVYLAINIYYQQASTCSEPVTDPPMWQALDPYSSTMNTPKELRIGRDAPHSELPKFSKDDDETFKLIYERLRQSKGPGITFVSYGYSALVALYISMDIPELSPLICS